MGLKNNFFQAMRELFGGDTPNQSDEYSAPVAPRDSSYAQDAKADRRVRASEQDVYPSQASGDISPEYQFEDRMKNMLASSGLVGEDLQTKAQASQELDSLLRKPEPQSQPVQPVPVRVAEVTAQERERAAALERERTAAFERERAAALDRERAATLERERAAAFERERTATQGRYAAPDLTREPAESARPADGVAQSRYSAPHSREGDEGETFPRPASSAAEVTIISKNTLVTGNIRSFAGIYIEGSVNGNIDVVKNADINGKIIGNVSCSDTRLNGALIQGDVSSKGRVFMDKNAMLVGNMSGQSMDIDGKVKGDVEVGGRIGLRENSVVIGNINASTIAISDGANVQGFINTTFLRDNAEMVFPKQITLVEEESAFTKRD